MNFIQLLNSLENYAKSIKFVNETHTGSLYEYLNGQSDVKYANVNIDINSATHNKNVTVYSVYLYYTDRLLDDKSNWKTIKSTAETVLSSIVNFAINEIGDVNDGWVVNYFEQKFADNTAGGWVNFQLEVPNVLGQCLIDDYYNDTDANLIERLEEAIRQYEQENAELTVLLKDILYKLNGEVL